MNNHANSPPLVTVVMPFFNAASTIRQTITSIQQQSLDNFELLAVDDGSTDDSAAIVAGIAASERRMRLLQPGRLGVVAAANTGMENARSTLIARMDADDLMHPQRLEKQYRFLCRNPEIDLVGCQVSLFPEEIIQKGYSEYIRWQNNCLSSTDIADEIYVELPIANPSVMFRRDVVQALGGYRDGPHPEDYDLLLRMIHTGHKLAKIPEVLLHWRESRGRLTRTDERYSRNAFNLLRADFLTRDPRLQSGRPIVAWGAGRKSRKRSSLLLERGINFETWIDIDPRKIGNRVQGIPVVAPSWLDREQRPFVLGYVNNHGARELIAAELEAMGYHRGRDYLMVG